MKPYLRVIAELWIKENKSGPITDQEMREWKEAHEANRKSKHQSTSQEVVMAYLWDQSLKRELCEIEKHLLKQALDKNLLIYMKWRELQNQMELALKARDFSWQKELREKLKAL